MFLAFLVSEYGEEYENKQIFILLSKLIVKEGK